MPSLSKCDKDDLQFLSKKICDRVDELERENEELKAENESFKEAIAILLSNTLSQKDHDEACRKLFIMFYGEKLPELLRELIIEQGIEPYNVIEMLEESLKKVS